MKPQSHQRRGITVVEVVVSAAVLTAIVALVAQLSGLTGRLRRSVDDYQLASRTLDNVLEEFTHRPWKEITPQSAGEVMLPDDCQQRLADARLVVAVDDVTTPAPARRVTMALTWGRRTEPLTLVDWVLAPAEAAP